MAAMKMVAATVEDDGSAVVSVAGQGEDARMQEGIPLIGGVLYKGDIYHRCRP